MPNINFPTSPALNDQYSFEGKTWTYNGVAWVLTSSPTSLRLDAAFAKANSALSNTNLNVSGTLRALNQGGDEGGELFLDKPVTNTSLAAGVTIDIFQNKLRFFETGGSVRGVFIDIANGASAGVGTNLLEPNTTSDGWARGQANAAFGIANSASSYANGAFSAANSAQSTASSAQSTASSAESIALGAQSAASAAQDTATSSYIHANAAFSAANNAFNASQPLSGEFDYGLITDVNNTIQDYGTL
jgi:hypothetical protein